MGQLPGNGPGGEESYRLSSQQPGGDGQNSLRIAHHQPLPPGPLVHGEHSVYIGGRGNDRDSTDQSSNLPGQIVGSAQMAGEDGDDKLSSLVHHDHRRVGALVAQMRGNRTNRDARCPHKNEPLGAGESPLCPFLRLQPIPGIGGLVSVVGQSFGQLLCQGIAPLGKGDQFQLHSAAPSREPSPCRNSVVKPGW